MRNERKPAMKNTDGVSVIIPTNRTNHQTLDNLSSVAQALNNFDGLKELVLAADRRVSATDFLRTFAQMHSFVRILEGEVGKGSARTRLEALKEARYSVILFTDDDCVVPPDWVVRIYQTVRCHGVIAGNLNALHPEDPYSAVDAYVDQLRIRTMENGGAKYISFPNFGVRRDLLPEEPFSPDALNTTEDIELACGLRLAKTPIRFEESIIVRTEYPTTLVGLMKRKAKHARGVAFLRANLNEEKRVFLGINETPWKMLFRWSNMTLRAPLTLPQRLCMLLANTVYCSALGYYDTKFRHLKPGRQK